MKKILFSFSLIALTTTACSPVDSTKPFDQKQAAAVLCQNYVTKPARQEIEINLPHKRTWKRIDNSLNSGGTPLMLIPKNESEAYWTESIRTNIAGYVNEPDITADKYVQRLFQRTKADCKDIHAVILSNTEKSTSFLLDMSSCRHHKNQTQIGKAFNGVDAVYMVRYSALYHQVSEKEFADMTRAIKNAKLVNR